MFRRSGWWCQSPVGETQGLGYPLARTAPTQSDPEKEHAETGVAKT